MRLVCPNCGATYEVPDDVIPVGGRDVQCSNCNNTWFQLSSGADITEDDQTLTASVPQAPVDIEPAPAEASEDTAEPQTDNTDDADHTDEAAEAPQMPSTMSPEAEDILRQEAEFAAQMRAADTAGLETQPDLGLDSAESTREAQMRDRLSKLKGIEPEEIAAVGAGAVAAAGAGAAAATSRRDLLPDIEEINSTLNSADHETATVGDHDPAEAQAERRKGFRFGFLAVLLVFAVLIALYLFAPQIAQMVPALAGILDSYTSAVDSLRMALDGWMASFGEWINGLMQQATDGLTGGGETDAPAPETTDPQ